MAFLGFLQVTAFVLNLLPDPGTGRLRRTGAAPEPGDTARTGTGQAVGILHPAVVLLFTPQLNRWFFEFVFWFFDFSGVPPSGVATACNLTRFWSAWF